MIFSSGWFFLFTLDLLSSKIQGNPTLRMARIMGVRSTTVQADLPVEREVTSMASRGAHQPDIGFQLKCIERSNV